MRASSSEDLRTTTARHPLESILGNRVEMDICLYRYLASP